MSTGSHPVPHRVHWLHPWVVWLLVGLVAAASIGVGTTSSAPLGATHRVLADDAAATVIARYRARELSSFESVNSKTDRSSRTHR